jgi:hypothetical protein
MDGTVYTALVSGVVALGTVTLTQTLTYFFSRKNAHQADWRKLKLEQYTEYLLALSRIVRRDSDMEAQRRYADAANSLTLVAPSKILADLYAFQDELGEANQNHDPLKANSLLNLLMRDMREDCHPRAPEDKDGFQFRMLDLPSDKLIQGKGKMTHLER